MLGNDIATNQNEISQKTTPINVYLETNSGFPSAFIVVFSNVNGRNKEVSISQLKIGKAAINFSGKNKLNKLPPNIQQNIVATRKN